MREMFTKSMARNIYFGGSVFFILLFLALTYDTHRELPNRDNRVELTPQAVQGKQIWEENNCVGCHTLLGEGAYFAPELANVYDRRGPEFIKTWIKIQPTGAPGRRQMPNFHLTDEEIDALVAFLKYVNGIDAEDWPPNIEG
ncbi:MAG: cytochrome c [Candidatus Competibacteraceae bacterium]|nr:cytochrome c [Candidatus Competibacteraceae bacterium]